MLQWFGKSHSSGLVAPCEAPADHMSVMYSLSLQLSQHFGDIQHFIVVAVSSQNSVARDAHTHSQSTHEGHRCGLASISSCRACIKCVGVTRCAGSMWVWVINGEQALSGNCKKKCVCLPCMLLSCSPLGAAPAVHFCRLIRYVTLIGCFICFALLFSFFFKFNYALLSS